MPFHTPRPTQSIIVELSPGLPAPSGSDQLNQDSYLITMPRAGRIVGAQLTTDTATSGSDATNNYTFTLLNNTQSLELAASAVTTNGAELSPMAPKVITVDQNQNFAANDVFMLRTDINDDGGAGPTDLSSAVIKVQINYL